MQITMRRSFYVISLVFSYGIICASPLRADFAGEKLPAISNFPLLAGETPYATRCERPKSEKREYIDLFPLIVIDGEITARSVPRLLHAAAELRQKCGEPWQVAAILDSPGGDLEAAMQLGRIFRAVEIASFVPRDAQCASACVFVLAGSWNRNVAGPIIVHRPFFAALEQMSLSERNESYRGAQAAALAFLREMNLPDALLDTMNATDPSDSRSLSANELVSLGIGVDDPVFAEESDVDLARTLDISRMELNSRFSYIRENCAPRDSRCRNKFLVCAYDDAVCQDTWERNNPHH